MLLNKRDVILCWRIGIIIRSFHSVTISSCAWDSVLLILATPESFPFYGNMRHSLSQSKRVPCSYKFCTQNESIEHGPAGWGTGDRGHKSKRRSEKRTLNEVGRREDGEGKRETRERKRERERESEGGKRRQKRASLREGSLPCKKREPREGPINN